MAIRDNYGYENAKYALLKQPSIDVTSAFGRANHFLDTIQEGVYIEAAMPYTSRYIHNVAHKMLKWLDDFSDILHERHLMTIYPPVPQLDEDVRDMNRVFEIVIQIFDEVQEVPRALSSLKYFYENAPQYHIICAGSLLGIALHQGTSFPVGKVDFLKFTASRRIRDF